MQTKIAEMIHYFRKKRNVTQQHLADVMGVSVGTISKWENGITVPDLSLLMDLATYFKTSTDVLIGYQSQSVTREAVLSKLKEMRARMCEDEVISLCAMAEDNFPNDFEVIYACGTLMELRCVQTGRKEDCELAKKYLTRSIALVAQNQDTHINMDTLGGEIGMVEILAGNMEEGIAQLENHNAGGMYDIRIANALLSLSSSDKEEDSKRYEKAMDYLSGSLLDEIGNLIMLAVAWLNAAEKRKQRDFPEAQELALSIIHLIDSLFGKDGTAYLNKYTVMLYGALAVSAYENENAKQGDAYLQEAYERAKNFDGTKQSDKIRYMHFSDKRKPAFADDFGNTAMDGLVSMVNKNAAVCPELKEAFYGMYSKDN